VGIRVNSKKLMKGEKMVKITEEMKGVINQTKVVALATATEAGEPNVVPIAYKKVLSENELLLMSIFMRKTEENIKMNPEVAVSAWYTDSSGSSKGYQLKGQARFLMKGQRWFRIQSLSLSQRAPLLSMWTQSIASHLDPTPVNK